MRRRRILIADDEQAIVLLISHCLKERGYEVVSASDGEAALERVKSWQPDLIILDVNMPKMSGIDFYHAIADLDSGSARIPVLMLTGRADLGPIFKDLQIAGFMEKPFEVEHLLDTIADIISRHYGAVEIQARSEPAPARKIMLIEDDDKDFNELVMFFLHAGYEVVREAADTDALFAVRAKMPDLILMRLAGAPPLKAETIIATRIRSAEEVKHIPLVLYHLDVQDYDSGTIAKLQRDTGVTSILSCAHLVDILLLVDGILGSRTKQSDAFEE